MIKLIRPEGTNPKADERNGFNYTICELVERTISVRYTSAATSASGTVNIQPSTRENRLRSSSKSTLTIQRPTVADTTPTTVINEPPSSSAWKRPGVKTVNDDISWLERIQYSHDP